MDKNFPYKIRIDLSKVDLYGWELSKSKWKVENLVQKINEGIELPPVSAYFIDENTYQLTRDFITNENRIKIKDGGHSRALAHYKANKPLELVVIGEKSEVDMGSFLEVNVRDIKLNDTKEAYQRFLNLQKRDKNYR